MKDNKTLPGISRVLALLLLFSLFSNVALANMSVYPMELGVDASGTAIIKVASKSDDIQFVRVTQKRILNPGTPHEKEVEIASWKKDGLIVTPAKFALAAGSMRVVRLVSLSPPTTESTWRVYFEGVKQPDVLLSGENKTRSAEAKLGVNVIWGALVHIAPERPKVSLEINPALGEVINTGNVRVPLKEIGFCRANASCKWIKEDATVYPGTQRKLKSLSANSGATYKFRYFNWLSKTSEEAELPVAK
ncbi:MULTISPECIES: fimbrial protein [Serratia]|uniref:fimbrial protein n=1 Tax=Serratia TaxID=613 RepID=UPI001D02BC57|nr:MULTISPECIES: fimbrial protein [Serratia]MDP8857345.1 fimbrial protein [Serratia marcescens]UTL85192.1 fimbrial protein [Serratia marcescens]UYY66788.1 fimbrial protein [Serratia marcescens]